MCFLQDRSFADEIQGCWPYKRHVESGLLAARYSAARLPRTTDVVRWSRRAAAMTTWTSPPAVAFRNTVTRLTGTLAPKAALRSLTPIYGWQPPDAARPAEAG